jgi:crotonobetainyl-CoA:carnitine CoA-transferase CaiB-like acyl-CoA transferase
VQPLDGIRVLDLGTYIAGPFAATILGEFGAEVIKVEPPAGDHLRRFGSETECGDTLVWLSESRNKRSVRLDLGQERGRAVLRELVEASDVVIENYRPGVLERWGLAPETIRARNPGTILVRISAYGQTGPLSDLPGFARIAHGFSGLAFLAGEPDGPPVTPGSTSLADYMSGMYGAVGALLALRSRDHTGEGQVIDLALYESTFRVLDEIAPAFQQFGFVRQRMGADTVNVVPHGHFECADGRWMAVACSNDGMFARLARAMGRPDLSDDDRWGPKERRLAERPAVNAAVAGWTASMSRDAVLAACRDHDVPAGPLYSIDEIFEDPQYAHRETIVTQESRIGPLAVPGVLPTLSDTPGSIRWLGQALGADTDAVLAEVLGRTVEQITELRTEGVI